MTKRHSVEKKGEYCEKAARETRRKYKRHETSFSYKTDSRILLNYSSYVVIEWLC